MSHAFLFGVYVAPYRTHMNEPEFWTHPIYRGDDLIVANDSTDLASKAAAPSIQVAMCTFGLWNGGHRILRGRGHMAIVDVLRLVNKEGITS